MLSFQVLQAHTGDDTAYTLLGEHDVHDRCLKGCTDNGCSLRMGQIVTLAGRQDHGGGGTEVERHLFKKYKLEGKEG